MNTFEAFAAEICKSAVELGRNAEMHVPFVRNGWQYATDSSIIIRRKTAEPDTPGDTNILSADKLEELGWDTCGSKWPLPPPPPERQTPCGECVDGVATETCPACDGRGAVRCELNFKRSCPECNGGKKRKPPRPCGCCNGTGSVRQRLNVRLGRRGPSVRDSYLRMLSDHGIVSVWGAKEDASVLRFTGDGFAGLVVTV